MIYLKTTHLGYDIMIEFNGESYEVGAIEEFGIITIFHDYLFDENYRYLDLDLGLVKDAVEAFYSSKDTIGRIEDKFL